MRSRSPQLVGISPKLSVTREAVQARWRTGISVKTGRSDFSVIVRNSTGIKVLENMLKS